MFRELIRRRNDDCRAPFIFSRVCALVLALCLATVAHAQAPDVVTTQVKNSDRMLLRGHHPNWANDQNDIGALPADTQLESLTLVLARPAEREEAFEQFLKDQLNSASPDFHHWLTPVEIGQRYGVSKHDIDAIKGWLESQNLHFDSVSSSLARIRFSGPASAVASAFGSDLHYYMVGEEKRISISAEAQIPAALGPVIQSVTGLYSVNLRPMHSMNTAQMSMQKSNPDSSGSPAPQFTASCNGSPCYFIAPADFSQIYDLNLTYENGMHGEGQTIAIIGRSAVDPADITNFQMRANLPQIAPTVIVPPNGIAPPAPATTQVSNPSGDQGEATVDVQRAGSIAYGADIDLVVSANTLTAGGLDIAAEYVVDTTPVFAQVMSISFGSCEAQSASGVPFWDSLFQQASGEGISVLVASGDSGAAGCDASFATPPATQIASPNYICSSSYATCVGGTEFVDTANPSLYWRSTNSGGFESAFSYIPEGAWNEPTTSSGQFQPAASGGGVSSVIPTPSWQTGPGVPTPGAGRYTPDVAFSASGHDGYFGCFAAAGSSCVGTTSFQFAAFSGTSASAQDMAGIAAILNQSEGKPQGNLNPILYQLATETSADVFNDITVATSGVSNCVVTTPSMCNNSTPGPSSLTGGLNGFLVAPGYDEATGLGSINVGNLLTHWNNFVVGTAPSTTTVTSNINPSTPSQTIMLAVQVSTTGTFASGTATIYDGSSVLATVLLNQGSFPPTYIAGAAIFIDTLDAGSHSITAVYNGDFNFVPSTSPAMTQVVTGSNAVPRIIQLGSSSGLTGQDLPGFSVTASNIVIGASINFGGTNYPGTVSLNGQTITANIPASAVATPGVYSVSVVNPAPGGGASGSLNFTVTNPGPVITSVSPTSSLVGQAIPAFTVTGTNIISGATVTFNGTSNAGTVSNGGTTITASIPASELMVGGNVPITVVNPAPGGGTSNALSFAVNNLVPTITSISPTSALVNQQVLSFTVTGTNFAGGAALTINGMQVSDTVSNNGTTISATIAIDELPNAGIVPVVVTNPAPGGGPSNTVNFTVNNPVPSLTSISPTTAPTGSVVVVTAIGTGFATGSALIFNGISSPGTVTNGGTTLTATVAASSLPSVGTASVKVTDPTPGGGSSNSLNFVVDDFSVTGPTQPLTITAGQPASFTMNFATQGGTLPATMSFSASNLPPETTAMFNPSSVPAGTASGTTTFSLTTTAHSAAPSTFRHFPAMYLLALEWFAGLALCFLLFDRINRNARIELRTRGVVVLLVLCGALIAGCGSSSSGTTPIVPTGPNPASGTAAGNYPITITVTAGAATRSTTVTLVVQ
jgi:pseudomonalisin